MSPGQPCLVDSNILFRRVQPDDPDYAEVESALSELARRKVELCYTSQNLGEFWNACTRPKAKNGYGMSPEEADHKAKIYESRLRLLPDNLQIHLEWRRLLVEYRVSGVQVHDTRLVAAMNVYGVEHILTFNTKDFERFKNIKTILPKEVNPTF